MTAVENWFVPSVVLILVRIHHRRFDLKLNKVKLKLTEEMDELCKFGFVIPSPSSSGDGSDGGGVIILIVGDVIVVEVCCLAGELILGNSECH